MYESRFPTLEWADLTMDDSVTGEMVIRHREGHAAAWHDVRVHREEVLRAFPIQPGQSSGKDTFKRAPVPSGFYPLEKAVLLIAKEIDSSLWDREDDGR